MEVQPLQWQRSSRYGIGEMNHTERYKFISHTAALSVVPVQTQPAVQCETPPVTWRLSLATLTSCRCSWRAGRLPGSWTHRAGVLCTWQLGREIPCVYSYCWKERWIRWTLKPGGRRRISKYNQRCWTCGATITRAPEIRYVSIAYYTTAMQHLHKGHLHAYWMRQNNKRNCDL